MKGKYFLDTNVFVYSFDDKEPEKKSKSEELINTALKEHKGIISYQVIQEFLNVATGKFKVPISIQDCHSYINFVLEPMCEVFSSTDLFRQGLEIKSRWKYSFYDSLIIAAALNAGCKTLYSEDLQTGQEILGMEIVNPYKSEQ